jgi:transketolase
LTGDGELGEGQIWEAALFGSAKKIDNLIAIVDYNRQQIDGPVTEVLDLGDLRGKWEAFGWTVLEMRGNDMEDVLKVLEAAKAETGKQKPVIILMHTEMGKGVDFMEGTHHWHGVAPNDAQLKQALAQLEETLGDY